MSFGTGGKVLTNLGPRPADEYEEDGKRGARAVAIQRDGKILAVGGNGSDFALARYNADGASIGVVAGWLASGERMSAGSAR